MGSSKVPGYSVRNLLFAFAFAVSLPLVALLAVLLLRSTTAEREELERRLLQVASNLAELIDRDIDRSIALLQTLATSPAISNENWPSFYEQAKAALADKAYLVLVDSTGRQIVNTYVPFGTEPSFTGDPETVRSLLASKVPVVSNLFVSLVVKEPVYNISIPVRRNGNIAYVMSLGLLPGDLASTLRKLALNPSWVTTIWDRHGVILARSHDHDKYLAQKLPDTARDGDSAPSAMSRITNLDGENVLVAVAKSKLSGWGISVSVPVAVADAPLRNSILMWGFATTGTLTLASFFGFLVGRLLVAALSTLSYAARVPLGKRLQEPSATRVREVNEVSQILFAARKRQNLLLREVSHRAKNMLAVVQALVTQTLRGDHVDADRRKLIIERLHALARAHDALVAGNWSGIPVSDVVRSELAPFQDRVTSAGPPVFVKPDVVESLTLVLHELVTNAIKYGALSTENGRIVISWRIDDSENTPTFHFEWREEGGPPVQQPVTQGLGLRLLRQALSGAKSEVDFLAQGISFRLTVALSEIVDVANGKRT